MPLDDWKKRQLQQYKIYCFYYISYIDNAESIFQHGILPKNKVLEMGLNFKSFADEDVQFRRSNKSYQFSDKTARVSSL